jgi:hypothetical protein
VEQCVAVCVGVFYVVKPHRVRAVLDLQHFTQCWPLFVLGVAMVVSVPVVRADAFAVNTQV